ncbi:TonB-dependent siderophore receptor [Mitsuaria sp. 7]|uniref:TonB-dependent receptor n=1 Tax=Mitsuaria sp. 7 TaxID=1658665 RepID=UPI0007DDA001|nr:TonB-dependent siderophore receptor [Mitsuaria sp. 7]ANH67463.1 TonB-dependent receptor [Mitsuaria sp. 7]
MTSHLLWSALLWPLLVHSLPLHAQQDSAHDHSDAVPTALPEVRISSPRSATSASGLALGNNTTALETPFSVSRIGAELLRDQVVTSLQEALRNVPGAQADSGFNGSHTQFFILRGAVADSGTGSNRILRDGVRLSNYPYTPAFVESVDVLRGPGAAVGVRSEPGGTVNIRTLQPEFSNFGSLLLSGGSDRQQEVSFDMNRLLSADRQLAARVTVTRSNASEWRHVPDRLDGIKLGIAKHDGERYHLRAGIEATDQVYRPDYGLPALNGRPVAVPPDRQLSEPFGDSSTRNRIIDLHGDVAWTPTTRLALDVTHLEAESTSIRHVLAGAPLPSRPAGTWGRVTSWEPGTTRRIDSGSASVNSRHAIAGVEHQLYLGLDLYREILDQPTLSLPQSTGAPINVYDPVYGLVTAPGAGVTTSRSLTTQNLRAAGVSLQDQIDLGDWSLVAGVRLDRQRFLYGAAGVQAISESHGSPKLAVLRRFGDRHTVYANVATGIAPNQVASSTNQSLPSRQSSQMELGWKSLWNGGRLSTDVAVYRLDQSNLISSDLSTADNFDFNVAGKARSQGVEASLTGQWTDRWRVSASAAYTDAAYGYNAVYGGKRVPNVARQTANLWAQYAWNDAWKTSGGLSVQGRRFADEANTTVLPGYARVDLAQSWAMRMSGKDELQWQLSVRNLFDKRYYASSHLHVARWITPGQTRSWTLSALYLF